MRHLPLRWEPPANQLHDRAPRTTTGTAQTMRSTSSRTRTLEIAREIHLAVYTTPHLHGCLYPCILVYSLDEDTNGAVLVRLQLCQRPFNRDCKRPNCNEDFISPMFRDHLMPARCVQTPAPPRVHASRSSRPTCKAGLRLVTASANAPCSASQSSANTAP